MEASLKAVLPEVLLMEIIQRGVRVMPPMDLFTRWSTCPHCGRKGQVAKSFGVRVLGGTVRPQSWCRDCRKNPDRETPRQNGKPKQKAPGKEELIALLKKSLANAVATKNRRAAMAVLKDLMASGATR